MEHPEVFNVTNLLWAISLLLGGYLLKEFHYLTKSVETLNTSMAVIVEKVLNHDKRLDHHDTKLEILQEKI